MPKLLWSFQTNKLSVLKYWVRYCLWITATTVLKLWNCKRFASFYLKSLMQNSALFGMNVLDSSDRKKQFKTSLVSHAVDTAFHFAKLSSLPWSTFTSEQQERCITTEQFAECYLFAYSFVLCFNKSKFIIIMCPAHSIWERIPVYWTLSTRRYSDDNVIDYKNHLRMLQLLNNVVSPVQIHVYRCSLASCVEGANTEKFTL